MKCKVPLAAASANGTRNQIRLVMENHQAIIERTCVEFGLELTHDATVIANE